MSTRTPVAISGLLADKLRDSGLREVARKLARGERLQREDGLSCFEANDLCGLGHRLALAVKKHRHGNRAFFIANHHLNYTNISENHCRFCAFHRPLGSPDSYAMPPEEAARRIAESPLRDLREVHLVGGCHPDLDLSYYLELLRAIARARPGVRLKAITAVEIAHVAKRTGLSSQECLSRLKGPLICLWRWTLTKHCSHL